MDKKIELGCTIKDRITGYTGVVTILTQYLHGETQIFVESSVAGAEPRWFHVSRVEVCSPPEA